MMTIIADLETRLLEFLGVNLAKDPVQIAARTAWGEARGQGPLGMQAVLNAVANRVADPGWWGTDICSVCLAHEQFSCWNVNDPNHLQLLAVTGADSVFRQALVLATRLADQALEDIVDGADSYYRIGSLRPAWATGRFYTKTVGQHAFYRVGVSGAGAPRSSDDLNEQELSRLQGNAS